MWVSLTFTLIHGLLTEIQNEKLQRAIVFGGYHPTLPTHVLNTTTGREMQFNYSYFGDTFLYDVAPSPSPDHATPTSRAPKWAQVLTAGFPTYRCQAQLAVDSTTGKTYMFGGWTNNQYIPTHTQMVSRSFGDVWELRVDLPGGNFEGVDVEEEGRVARAGPWQRCWACAAAGPWKKCGGKLFFVLSWISRLLHLDSSLSSNYSSSRFFGYLLLSTADVPLPPGTCKGRVFFCGTACFREGWAEHKRTHKCRKA
jgi:hypothetical protein